MGLGFRSNLEKDFEFFVRNIVRLEPIEFMGLAKVLSVPTVRELSELGLTPEMIKAKTTEELKEMAEDLVRPAEEIMEEMMNKFLDLPRRRRKEINQILKDAKRGK
jgi:hypothetical protein